MRQITDGLNPQQADELMAEAKSFANSKLFPRLMRMLREQYVDVLAGEQTYSLTAVDAHASIKALEQIQQQVKNLAAATKRG